jgi:hypothetical protein
MAAADREPTSELCRAARPARPQGGLSLSPPSWGRFLGPLADAKWATQPAFAEIGLHLM